MKLIYENAAQRVYHSETDPTTVFETRPVLYFQTQRVDPSVPASVKNLIMTQATTAILERIAVDGYEPALERVSHHWATEHYEWDESMLAEDPPVEFFEPYDLERFEVEMAAWPPAPKDPA